MMAINANQRKFAFVNNIINNLQFEKQQLEAESCMSSVLFEKFYQLNGSYLKDPEVVKYMETLSQE